MESSQVSQLCTTSWRRRLVTVNETGATSRHEPGFIGRFRQPHPLDLVNALGGGRWARDRNGRVWLFLRLPGLKRGREACPVAGAGNDPWLAIVRSLGGAAVLSINLESRFLM
jgi:hypothetical protein